LGIRGYFLILVLILLAGVSTTLVFAIRGRRRKSLICAAITLAIGGGWYFTPIVDKVASVILFPHDTVYSSKFSESAFRRVRKGEPKAETLRALGAPLEHKTYQDDGSEYWYYSRHGPRYKNYWNKIVVFDAKKGVVQKTISEFYSD
jgi:outer membrane protein assembly factor BamE (lipoprotein component of BamABCDE complex)